MSVRASGQTIFLLGRSMTEKSIITVCEVHREIADILYEKRKNDPNLDLDLLVQQLEVAIRQLKEDEQ